ncbi:glycosyltransferase [Ktedonosporobacter rubrisoli]|uniref:Glycosyltransferase n=1 Tax=Ktedonosporobacter rubrisoli TaxID=2509675 RepID=A0A4P6JRE6_KTERU|nr:glycosyltransferase [Ktedonosporobacter rubrisoli]QBD78029.1 glycosyltransferase [Ktedonosporobacter rubrisoli]
MTTRPYHQRIPEEILALSHERDQLRRRGQYDRADILKQQLEEAGYIVKDNPRGAHLVILPSIEVDGKLYRTARHLPSLLDEADSCTFSVNILAHNNIEQTRHCVESVLRFAGDTDIEIILVNNASQDGIDLWADALKFQEPRLHVLHVTRTMGAAEARNVGLKQSRGRYILLLDPSLELTGDIFTPLAKTLEDSRIGITGLNGLHTDDLRHFEESPHLEVEAIDMLCMAFRRNLLGKVGLFDERYRYPHYMDVDFTFAIRNVGVKARVTPDLPLTRHPEQQDPRLSEAERQRLAKRNFYRFLGKWGEREDLLLDA